MGDTKVRRQSEPVVIKQLWAGINYIRQQKQIANTERLTKYMAREYEMGSADVEKHLKQAVADGLIDSYTAVGFKGSKVGVEQEGFKIPHQSTINEVKLKQDVNYRNTNMKFQEGGEHDWYCFACHKPGKVTNCTGCWRVYHPECIEIEDPATFHCPVCKVTQGKPPIKQKEINRLLGYTVNRLKEKTRELHTLFTKDGDSSQEKLVFMPMDLNSMERKCKNRKYRFLEEFHADTETIYHNVVICFGDIGEMAELVRIMIIDCEYDLNEIRQCRYCYNYSNAKPKDWFCQPCRPTHELVYAKQKGFSFWPAKVIKVTEEGYDVRFFGGWHQRAVIAETAIKSLDTSLKVMNIKKTPGFNKAMDELRRHQALLEDFDLNSQEEEEETEEEEEVEEPIEEEELPVKPPPKKNRKKEKVKKIKEEKQAEESQETEMVQLVQEVDEVPEVKVKEPKAKTKKTKVKAKPKVEKVKVEVIEKPVKVKKKATKTPKASKRKRSLTDEEDEEDRRKVRRRDHYEFDDDSNTEVISSSSHATGDRNTFKAATPEDANLVTSSEDNIHPRTFSTNDTGTQTSRKLLHPGKAPHKGTQTDLEIASTSCNCEQKFNDFFGKYKQEMTSATEEKKEKALKEQADRLQKDFEEDKQQAVARAMSNVQREVERARRQAEERCKEQYMEEMKKLAQKHKAEISAAKKKQWCYNCEEEAMYHCCWNTSYCSIKCQQEHWHREHKRMCRRKR